MCHTDRYTNYDVNPLNNLEDMEQSHYTMKYMLIYIYV